MTSAAERDDAPRTRSRRGAPRGARRDRPVASVRSTRRGGRACRGDVRPGRARSRGWRSGWGGRAHAAATPASAAGRRAAPPFDWDGRRRALPDGVAARAVPRPRLAQPRERPDAPGVRRRAGGGAGARRRGSSDVGLPAAWRLRRGRGVVTWKSARHRRAVPAPDRRRWRAAGARGAPGCAGAAGRPEPRPERGVGESPARGRRGRAAARRDRRARRRRAAGGPAARRPARRGGPPGDARGDARRAGGAAGAPPVGRPAGARAGRAPRTPSRRGASDGGPRTGPRSGERATIRPEPGGLWHDRPMRPVIVAANWKMNTTPADAGELARTIASRTAAPAVERVICPPFVCLAAVARGARRRPASPSAPRTSTTRPPARTPATSARRCSTGLATWVIVGHSERRRDHGETDERIAGEARARGRGGPAADPVHRRAARGSRGGRDAAAAVVVDQLRGAVGPNDRRCALAMPASSSPTSRSGRSGPAENARGADAAAMAERDPQRPLRDLGWGERRRATCRSSTAAASPRRTSPSSSPSPRSTARSSAAPRSSPTRWPGSSPGRP